jgi:hypothetical protein
MGGPQSPGVARMNADERPPRRRQRVAAGRRSHLQQAEAMRKAASIRRLAQVVSARFDPVVGPDRNLRAFDSCCGVTAHRTVVSVPPIGLATPQSGPFGRRVARHAGEKGGQSAQGIL